MKENKQKTTLPTPKNITLSDEEKALLVSKYGKGLTDIALSYYAMWKHNKGATVQSDFAEIEKWVIRHINNAVFNGKKALKSFEFEENNKRNSSNQVNKDNNFEVFGR